MKKCGCRNVRKQREIKGSDSYVTMVILFKVESLEKIKIASSESMEKLERSGKGFITSLFFKSKVRPHKYKKERYAIVNVIKKNLSKISRQFEKLPYEIYEKKMRKH